MRGSCSLACIWSLAPPASLRRSLGLAALLALGVAGCGADPEPPPSDPCLLRPVVPGGAAELGLGQAFAAVADGQQVDLELGLQGLWMFLVNARVSDMDIGAGDPQGLIDAVALDQRGMQLSLPTGCREREFAQASDDRVELASPYFLPLAPDFEGVLEGAQVTIRLEVRDREGRRATDQRTVVIHFPGRGP